MADHSSKAAESAALTGEYAWLRAGKEKTRYLLPDAGLCDLMLCVAISYLCMARLSNQHRRSAGLMVGASPRI
jgi:hypothetical protein